MSKSGRHPKPGASRTAHSDLSKAALPISPPRRESPARGSSDGGPDLHIEEIEEKQIPKDRNIFDK